MKKFSLLTEYGETELRQLIAEVVADTLQQTLSKYVSQLGNSPPNNSQDKLLNRNEACKLLRVSLPTLAKLQKESKIKAVVVGGCYKYSLKHLNNFINGIR